MKEWEKFIEDCKLIFSSYETEDGDERPIREVKKGYISIIGDYDLNRILDGKTYQERFRIEIMLSKSENNVLPYVKLPCNKVKGFSHTYSDGTCCLGTKLEILYAWGDEYDADSFFEDVIDPYLINYASFRDCGAYAIGERAHGAQGIIDYYYSLLPQIPKDRIGNTLDYISKIIKTGKGKNKRHSPCPCGNGKKIADCHYELIQGFVTKLRSDLYLKEAFLTDQKYRDVSNDRKRNKKRQSKANL